MSSKYDECYIEFLSQLIEGILLDLDHMRNDIDRAIKMEQKSHAIINSALISLDKLKENTSKFLQDVHRGH